MNRLGFRWEGMIPFLLHAPDDGGGDDDTDGGDDEKEGGRMREQDGRRKRCAIAAVDWHNG